MRIPQQPHAPVEGSAYGYFGGESFAIVSRSRDPHAPRLLVAALGGWRMPADIDVSGFVGGDGAAAIEAGMLGDEVTLRLEAGAVIVQARVEHGGEFVIRFGQGIG